MLGKFVLMVSICMIVAMGEIIDLNIWDVRQKLGIETPEIQEISARLSEKESELKAKEKELEESRREAETLKRRLFEEISE